jgi:hypothetical protein
MKFSDLDFQPHPSWVGVQARHFFDNGYGVSIIQSPNSYGGGEGLYELAVLEGNEDDFEICYHTHITEDVIGHLTEEQVETYLCEIEKL